MTGWDYTFPLGFFDCVALTQNDSRGGCGGGKAKLFIFEFIYYIVNYRAVFDVGGGGGET